MNDKILAMAVAAAISVSAAAYGADSQQTMQHPHPGPYAQKIAGVANWDVPTNYFSLDEDDTTRLMEKMQNPGITDSWLFGPRDLEPWFAVVSYDPVGHVADDEKLDADKILEQLKSGVEASNEERRKRGWSELKILGWQVAPHYEPDTKRLSWAVLNESGGERNINYTTKILSRTGVATVVLVTSPEKLDASVADLKKQLASFSFNQGERYSEFKAGDKVAEYGLTGLIVGGAAAAAVKTGAWKWLLGILAASWKAVAAVCMAAVAGVKSWFGRKKA